MELRQLQQGGSRNATDGPQQEQSYFKPTSLVQVSKSWKGAVDSWRAHLLAISDPIGRCSGPLWVLGAGGLLPVITVPPRSPTHREKAISQKEFLVFFGRADGHWVAKHTFLGTGKWKRSHREKCAQDGLSPRNRVHLQHMLQPHS